MGVKLYELDGVSDTHKCCLQYFVFVSAQQPKELTAPISKCASPQIVQTAQKHPYGEKLSFKQQTDFVFLTESVLF